MGHLHHAPVAATAEDIASRLPALEDRDVARLIAIANAYNGARTVLMALGGLLVLRSTKLDATADVVGTLTGLVDRMTRARCDLSGAVGVRHPAARSRTITIARALDLLDQELNRALSEPHTNILLERLHAVHVLLSGTAVPDAGMREFSSTSCASWHSHHHHHH